MRWKIENIFITFESDFGIKNHKKFDMPLNKYTKQR